MDASQSHYPTTESLYDRYADMLFRLAFLQMHNSHDAEDAVADVFVKYMAAPPAFRSTEHEKAWFIRVLLNRCKDMHRRNAVRAYTPLEEAAAIHAENSSDETLEQVSQLPEKHRTVILLHYFEGFSLEEMASILQTTTSAVKMRLMRARNALKPLLKGE